VKWGVGAGVGGGVVMWCVIMLFCVVLGCVVVVVERCRIVSSLNCVVFCWVLYGSVCCVVS